MNLSMYLCKMIAQEAQSLGNLALANDENNCNFKPIKSVYERLSRFVADYDEFSRTKDII